MGRVEVINEVQHKKTWRRLVVVAILPGLLLTFSMVRDGQAKAWSSFDPSPLAKAMAPSTPRSTLEKFSVSRLIHPAKARARTSRLAMKVGERSEHRGFQPRLRFFKVFRGP